MGFYTKTIAVLLPVVLAYCWLNCTSFDPESIRGKRILLTGASSGIGEQVAYQYAELGAKLIITARRAPLLDKVAAKCKELGAQQVWTVPADMADPADRKKVVEATKKHLGGLDILILNHALLASPKLWKGSAENVTFLSDMFIVNVLAFVDISSQLSGLLEESRGYMGVVSSGAGKMGLAGAASYCTSKHALQGFYASLRQEYRIRNSGVSVTLVVFGPVDTERGVSILEENSRLRDRFKTMAGDARQAAIALIEGVSARNYEVYFPAMSLLAQLFYRLVPYASEDVGSMLMGHLN